MNTEKFSINNCNYIVHYVYCNSNLVHCVKCKDLKELSEFCSALHRELSFFEVISFKHESITKVYEDENIRELFKNYRDILEDDGLSEMCEPEKEPEQSTVSREEWHHIKNSLKY